MAEGEGDGLGVAAEHAGAGGGHEVMSLGGVEACDGERTGGIACDVFCNPSRRECFDGRIKRIKVILFAGLPESKTVIFPLVVLFGDFYFVKYSGGSIFRSVISPH